MYDYCYLEKCIPESLKGREHEMILGRIQFTMKAQGMQWLILNNWFDTFYATGYCPLMDSAVSVVPAEGAPVIVVSTLESEAASAMTTSAVEVRSVKSWVFIDDGTPESREIQGTTIDKNGVVGVVADVIASKPLQGKIGINMSVVSKNFWYYLIAHYPECSFTDCTQMLKDIRIIKTPWEIQQLRLAAQDSEKAYRMVVDAIRPGMPAWKIDALYVHAAAQLNLEHGTINRRHSFLSSVGEYFGLSGMPRGKILTEGDVVKMDCGFRYNNYSSDIARMFVVGDKCSRNAEEIYAILYHGYLEGRKLLRPGVKMSDIYWAVRNDVEQSDLIPLYPRGNMGHSIGCGLHTEEYPTISAGTDLVLEPNMVVCLETPYSGAGNAPIQAGVNIEDTFLITETGCEAFTSAPDNIYWR